MSFLQIEGVFKPAWLCALHTEEQNQQLQAACQRVQQNPIQTSVTKYMARGPSAHFVFLDFFLSEKKTNQEENTVSLPAHTLLSCWSKQTIGKHT